MAKTVLDVKNVAQWDARYQGAEHSLAGFFSGMFKGDPTELILVKQRKATFFQVVNNILHEMIHMYDHHFGPESKILDKYGCAVGFNLNYPFEDPVHGISIGVKDPKSRKIANIANAALAGFKKDQLPDEILAQIDNPAKSNALKDRWPRQFYGPGEPLAVPVVDPATGEKKFERIPHPLPRKYKLDGPPDGMYDLHGSFFQSWAKVFNGWGFYITDVAVGLDPTHMVKTNESENVSKNIAEFICGLVKAQGKSWDYQDKNNWYVQFS